MAIISSTLVLRTNALLHLYASWLLITHPSVLPTQNLVLLLGNSMRLPDPSGSSFSNAGAASALAGLAIAIMAVSDLIATFVPLIAYDEHWSAVAPLRGTAYLLLSTWIYWTGQQPPGSFGTKSPLSPKGWGDELKNSLVFSWTFVQMTVMFWVSSSMRHCPTQCPNSPFSIGVRCSQR